jgi:hypothetical protein
MTIEIQPSEDILTDMVKENIFSIEPEFLLPPNYNLSNLESFIDSMEKLLFSLLPENFFTEIDTYTVKNDLKTPFLKFNELLPILTYTKLKDLPPFCFSFCVLCFSDLTYGINQFASDMLNKWLIPGKPVVISAQRSIRFRFKKFPFKNYYLAEYFINIASEKELNLIKKNLSGFINEMKLIILSVQHARQIISIDKLSNEQKSHIIKEDIYSLLDRTTRCAFGQMENFLFKLSEEKKLKEIKENLALLMYKKPKIFDRDIFNSLHNASLIFNADFTSLRNPRYISKIIAVQYFFKKSIQQTVVNLTTKKRIINLKLFKTNVSSSTKSVLGIIIVMNQLHENEHFEKSYILESISQIIKDFNYVNNSYIVDHRDDKLLSFYLEIEKTTFSINEINELKLKLPEKFKEKMNNLINPIFLPRNEEEIFRNIIVLSKQLIYVKDIPQLMITYEKQTSKEICFNIILLRLIKDNTPPLKDLFYSSKTFLNFSLDESKVICFLKKKYPKESNIFRVSLNKFPFLRRDYSLDLRKARQAVTKELLNIIGEFRDFNGGLLIKQCEALDSVKKLLPNLKNNHEFLLENFFYSIKPGIMQCILDAEVTKTFFLMFTNILEKTLENKNYTFSTHSTKNHFLIMIKTNLSKLKEDIILGINKLKLKSFELISSSLDIAEDKTLGYILLSNEEEKKNQLFQTIKSLIDPNSTISIS